MPETIHFIFGIHCHQPVGNFDHVFREATEKSYRPFLEVARRHPGVKLTLHYTGILLDWLDRNDPALLAVIREMVARGQVEMMTGGFYEPILAVIPDADKVGQIRKQTEWQRRKLGAEAKGLWLAERVWEPHLAKPLREAGVEFLTVDDSHFKASGVSGAALFHRHVTEEQGSTVEVFPILEELRYLIPFRPAQETIDFLRRHATEKGDRCAVMADDGEKFGVWPDTYDWVYNQGWLESFFTLLEQNSSWIKACTFSEYRAASKPAGRVYLPCASYTEMMEWAQPAPAVAKLEEAMAWMKEKGKWEDYGTFLRGGFWRNFLAKYEESNNLHKKMLDTARRIDRLGASDPAAAGEARARLWAGQCNCPYWHGVFGGLYLNHLRFAVYRELVAADAAADRALHKGKPFAEARMADFDGDGESEALLETDGLFLGLDPARGGRLFELDDRDRLINLGDTMTRRREAYHAKLLKAQGQDGGGDGCASIHDRVRSKEEGLEKRLAFDPYRRVSLIDHFMEPSVTPEAFQRCETGELGDFAEGEYSLELKRRGEEVEAHLSRLGVVAGNPVHVAKAVRVTAGGRAIEIGYRIENRGGSPLAAAFAVEFNFGLLAGDAPDRWWRIDGQKVEGSRFNSLLTRHAVREAALVDEWLNLALCLRADEPYRLVGLPIETISQSEGGFERVYQNTLVLPQWDLSLGPGQGRSLGLTLALDSFR